MGLIQPIRKSRKVSGLPDTRKVARAKPVPAGLRPIELTPQQELALRGIVATDLEAIVFRWLETHGYRPDTDFSFQSGLFGGRATLGGQVADFIITTGQAYPLVIRVMGEYWHEAPEQQGKDDASKALLEAMGYRVVDVWQGDMETALNNTMELALKGIEVR